MTPPTRPHHLYIFRPPYRMLVPLEVSQSLSRISVPAGSALVWCMGSRLDPALVRAIRMRPGALSLLTVLPMAREVDRPQDIFAAVDQCRPHSLLPYHAEPNPLDLRTLLGSAPLDLPGAVVEYVGWRGILVDLDMRRILRRVLDLSVEIRTVSALARALYMSRRALGRKFLNEGLPVPSHWLHFGRALRAALDLQRPGATLMATAYEHGYSDGFTLSNQMKRLTGLRPSEVTDKLGWEWVVESWLQEEIRAGGFRADQVKALQRGRTVSPIDRPTPEKNARQPA